MKYIALIILLTALINGCNVKVEEAKTQTPKYNSIVTKYTEIKEIASNEIDDTFYVYVRLPKYYKEETEKYPVIYLLDGDISFNMATSIVRYLQYGKDLPDVIIVGIGYGTMMDDSEQNFRERDYTISKIERFQKSGGGRKFLNFIQNELIPMIEKNYRVSDVRVLNGYSLGGLFTINTLLTEPDLFNYYIAGSPYLINDIESLLKRANQNNKYPNKKKLFLSVGENEEKDRYHIPIKQLKVNLESISNLEVEFIEFNNGTHFTSPSQTLTYGLKFVFDNRKQ